jgi:8-oxo-dGTP pyrophosphatase MutT (NUDIX family)
MNILAHIGQIDESIKYTDRPTVKVVIKRDDLVLLLNNGLLPGGGIDENESDEEAIAREIQEELGATVRDIEEIGSVVQYRNFLSKRYIIKGYVTELASSGGSTNPQDEGEAQFTQTWLTIQDALELVSNSIAAAKTKPMDDDANQGKLYNLMTTHELLKQLSLR